MKKAELLLNILEDSKNKSYGFYGTLKNNYDLTDQMVDKVWSHAVDVLTNITKKDKSKVEIFLDSRSGRHLADELSFYGATKGNLKSVLKSIDLWIKNPKAKNYIRYIK